MALLLSGAGALILVLVESCLAFRELAPPHLVRARNSTNNTTTPGRTKLFLFITVILRVIDKKIMPSSISPENANFVKRRNHPWIS